MAIKVLLVEDDRALREALADTLLLAGHDYRAVGSAEEALQAVEQESFSLVVSDVNMPGMDGHQLLGLLRARQPQLPVLLMTAHGAVERAVDAMRQGAADYLVKPFEPKALIELVARHALGVVGVADGEGPIAVEPASAQLLELAAKVARSDSTVLISGESGTGKEVLARYIHQQSHRASQPFIAINCAAIPDNMLEATLFGHEKGSFTGAIAAQAGKFEQADGGTILLDEISEMPLGLQAKLLRVLQEREVVRLGSRKSIPINVRVLAATNVLLEKAINAGHFREDLYYRLNVVSLQLHPLRERPGDILPLTRHFLRSYSGRLGYGDVQLSVDAERKLVGYGWPGNIRELENVIHHTLLICRDDLIQADDLRLSNLRIERQDEQVATEETADALLQRAFQRLFEEQAGALHEKVEDALLRAAYRFRHTASLLGLSRNVTRARLIAIGELVVNKRRADEVRQDHRLLHLSI